MRSAAGKLLVCLCACALAGVVLGRSLSSASDDDERAETPPSNFVGDGTNELATTLLQGFVEEEKDFVFSPLGYSVILAIMAEGARGETRNQLVNALHLPEDTYAVRQNYKQILSSMKERWTLNNPEFKNWFYVYKNYTVDDAYKKILLENYLTQVKHVDRVSYHVDFTNEGNEEDKNNEEVDESNPEITTSMIRTVEMKHEMIAEDGVTSSNQEGNKVNLAKVKEDIPSMDISEIKDKKEGGNEKIEDSSTSVENKDTIENEKVVKKDEVKVKNSVAKEGEIVQADGETKDKNEDTNKNKVVEKEVKSEKNIDGAKQSKLESKDVSDALTATPMIDRNSQEANLDPETKMIVFNGFYFRGNWKTPFVPVKDNEKGIFYKSKSEKKLVSIMRTSGVFNVGTVPELDAVALEMPYEGDQYSMLMILPNQRDGLAKLISDITGFSLNRIYKYFTDKPVEISMPKCLIQTISQPKDILQKNGVNDIFTGDADLSGISPDNLRLGSLVQLVNVHIDEGSADTNFLTAVDAASFGATRNNAESFNADHPFLFFIRDHTKNIVIAAGKVVDPKYDIYDFVK